MKKLDCCFLRAVPLTIAKVPLLKIVGLMILGQENPQQNEKKRLPIAILLPTYVSPTLMTDAVVYRLRRSVRLVVLD